MNTERERDVIGAMVLDSDALMTAMEHLAPESFAAETHRRIFRAIVEMDRRGEIIDLVTVTENIPDGVPSAYISECASQLPSISLAESAVRAVAKDYQQRESIRVYGEAWQRARDGDGIIDLAAWVDGEIGAIINRSGGDGLLHIAEIGEERWAEYEEMRKNPDKPIGITTGFSSIDYLTAGFQRGELTTLAARPSVGKSALAGNIALRCAAMGYRVAYFSLEMGRDLLFDRSMAIESNLNVQALRLGKVEKWIDAEEGFRKLGKLPFWVNDNREITTPMIRAQLRRLHKQAGVDLAIVDYLQLLKDRPLSGEQRHTQVGRMTSALRGMTLDFDGSMLMLSQLNRRSVQERRPPNLADLRESGAIEQDSDVVLLMDPGQEDEREDTAPKTLIDIIIAKNRNGPTGQVPLMFKGHRTQFEETTRRYGE